MLKTKTALVTGATQGIGEAIAAELAAAGADLVVHGIEPQARGDVVAATLAAAHGVRAAYVQADLADASQAAALVARATQALASPDILVNNAGIQHTSPIESFPPDRWDAIIAINLSAAFHGVALETATDGITVNCIFPGWTETPILTPQIDARAAQFGGDRDAAICDLLKEKQPNLTLLPPSRIGQVAVFLCSDPAVGITGVSLPVDGGWTAQ